MLTFFNYYRIKLDESQELSPSVKAKLDHRQIKLMRFVPIHYSLSLYLCMHAYICVYMYIHMLATGPMPEASEFDPGPVGSHGPLAQLANEFWG